MKNIILSFISGFLIVGCGQEKQHPKEEVIVESEAKDPVALGKELFEGTGNCFACHNPNQKIVGPTIIEIATIYKANKADMVAFLKGESEPIVDPSQYDVMKTNFAITKQMSDEELKAIEAYMYSFE